MGQGLNKRKIKNVLRKCENINLSEYDIERWMNRGVLRFLKEGDIVYNKGSKITDVSILKKGQVKDDSGNILTKDQIIASDFLANRNWMITVLNIDQNYTMNTDGKVFSLSIDKLFEIKKNNVNLQEKTEFKHQNKMSQLNFEYSSKLDNYKIKDFMFIER